MFGDVRHLGLDGRLCGASGQSYVVYMYCCFAGVFACTPDFDPAPAAFLQHFRSASTWHPLHHGAGAGSGEVHQLGLL